MQGQRSTVDSLPETFEFDHGASSNNSGFDQQIYWNNILNQVETQNLPNYLLSPTDENMSYMNTGNHEDAGMSIWSPGGPSSSAHPPNLGRHDETKMEHEWTSLTINAGGGPTIEQRRFNTTNSHSLENLNMNLNTDQDAEHSEQSVDTTCEASESGLGPNPMTGVLRLNHYSSNGSLNTPMDSTIGVGFMSEDADDRSSVDARRLACKRKNIEGFPGQSSTSGGTCFFQPSESGILRSVPPPSRSADTSIDLSSSSDYLYGASSSEEQLNPRISTVVRGMAPDCYPSPSVSGNAESSHRNFRLRTNDLSPPNLFTQGNISRRSGVWSPNQPPPLLIPFNHSLESRPVISESQRHMQIIHGLPRHMHSFPWSGTSDPRVANSSNSLSLEERSNTTRDETNSRTMLRNNFQEQAPFVPTADMRHLVQDPTNWNLVHGHINMNENVAPGINPVLHSSAGPTWAPHQNHPSHYHRNLSEAVRRNLASPSGSDSGGQNGMFSLQHYGSSSNSQETGHQSGAGIRPHRRSALLIERQSDGVLGVPLSVRGLAAAREGRSRMISEIRSALDLMRRGENLRFEDVFLLDPSLLYGGADLHDRHRDMRLDVDNMSYEELLALEERIGSVNTGLSDEVVSKHLKQQKYLPMTVEESMDEEPCCICQEEYVEGQDLGTLDCGHDFHTACIKQWLMQKNLCPICKTTALVT